MGEHAQWRNPESKSKLDATQSSVAEGVDTAISDWVTVERNRVLVQELSGEEEKLRGDLARGAEVKEVHTWKRFRAPGPLEESDVSRALVSTRWVIARRMVDGKKCVEALLQNATKTLIKKAATLAHQGASAFAPFICRSTPLEASKRGRFGELVSGTLFCERVAPVGSI